MIDSLVPTTVLLAAATVTGASDYTRPAGLKRTFQATMNAGTAAIDIEGSNDGVGWVVMASIAVDVSGDRSSAGVVTDSPWKYTRANVTAISGGNVTVTMGCRRDA